MKLNNPSYFCLSGEAKELKKLGYKQLGKPFGDKDYKMYEFRLDDKLTKYLDEKNNR